MNYRTRITASKNCSQCHFNRIINYSCYFNEGLNNDTKKFKISRSLSKIIYKLIPFNKFNKKGKTMVKFSISMSLVPTVFPPEKLKNIFYVIQILELHILVLEPRASPSPFIIFTRTPLFPDAVYCSEYCLLSKKKEFFLNDVLIYISKID